MLIITTHASCMSGGRIYILDSFMDVIPMLVFPVGWNHAGLNNKVYMYISPPGGVGWFKPPPKF
jgi:hypothetical protein